MDHKEELNHYSKIIIATNNINWLAYRLTQINDQIKTITPHPGISEEQLDVINKMKKHENSMLKDVATRLNKIAQDLGNYMDAQDAIDKVDEKVTSGAFQVLNEYLKR